ncbi:NAP1-related protein 2-like [Solanum tuberosum]|uniref:NAP1-related protein 2-like n=1 Tax=Solanum tuberosum TaxID=4113 RepID=UPI00073A506E|nr:PREDICTED: NAP1-related protein 2-like [Solanum tuberosum]
MGNDKWKKKIDHDGKQIVLCVERLQDELAKINQEASGELLKVAQKYNRIHQPIYEKRTNIIKYIPDFWLKSFLKHRGLVCAEEDRKIFEFLSSIKLEQSQDVKSEFTGSKITKDLENFVEELQKMFEDMCVVDSEHVELVSYQLKDVSRIWYDQWKKNRVEGAPLLSWVVFENAFLGHES